MLIPAALVLRAYEYTSSFFDLWSGVMVLDCVWLHVYGDGVCSTICRVLVYVITCGICLDVSCVGEHDRGRGLPIRL